MTNSEAIEQLKFDISMILFNPTTGEAYTEEQVMCINSMNYKTLLADRVAISALEENEKLKAQIGVQDRYIQKTAKDKCMLIKENLDMKAELEKSVKLPCELKLGQKFFYTKFGKPIKFEIVDFGWWLSHGLGAYGFGHFPENMSKLFIPFSEFGALVFGTIEEAEQALAERQEQ